MAGLGRRGRAEGLEDVEKVNGVRAPGASTQPSARSRTSAHTSGVGGHNPCLSLKDGEDGLLGRVWGEQERKEMVSEGNESTLRTA